MKVKILESTPNPEITVCRAARNDYYDGYVADTSYADMMAGVGGDDCDNVQDQTEHLLEDLMSKGHFGPFEHPQVTFAVKGISRSCMAQITRHRHASFDIQSQRYVDFSDTEAGDLIVTPQTIEDIHAGGRNPHGTSLSEVKETTGLTEAEIEEKRQDIFYRSIEQSVQDYNDLIDLGTPPEDARFVLPIGSKVNMVFTVNARMLMHVFDMRAGAKAQWEIRELSDEILGYAKDWMPHTFEYYDKKMKNRKNKLAP